jgi:hypothetical protein
LVSIVNVVLIPVEWVLVWVIKVEESSWEVDEEKTHHDLVKRPP